ncbi:MAG: hypothetical protein H6581_21300 [Bacteroidia bacterium]|nr:hypothetical protein [Bacteroidia bacterium]
MIFDQNINADSRELRNWETLENLCGLTQRVLGITTYKWKFARYDYHGGGTRRKPFELFDDVICKLLLQKDGLSAQKLQSLLGLDDDLGQKAFFELLAPLKESMIAGDSSYYSLTEKGRLYAREGSKYEQFTKDFSLILDLQNPVDLHGENLINALGKPGVIPDQEPYPLEFSQVLRYAESQEPSVHLPEKGFYLDGVQEKGSGVLGVEVLIGIIEDFDAHQEFFYALNPETGKTIPQLIKLLNHPEFEHLRQELFEKFTSEHLADQRDEEKLPAQKEEEMERVDLKSQLPALPEGTRKEKEREIKEKAESQRKSFNTLQFEAELERIASMCRKECWMISPWVRPKAFEKRKEQIKKMLKQGASVMIGYSSPYRRGDEEISSEILNLLTLWEKEEEGFFFAELPPFHEKIMMVDLGNGEKYEYTGSFNILSFSATGKFRFGSENMRRLSWGEDSESNYQNYRTHFVERQKTVFTRLYQEWAHKDEVQSPSEIHRLEQQIGFLGSKIKRLGKREADLPKWDEINELKLRLSKDLIVHKLKEINQMGESLIRENPGQVESLQSEMNKALALFPALSKDAFQPLQEKIAHLVREAELLKKLEKAERDLINLNTPLVSDAKTRMENLLAAIPVGNNICQDLISSKTESIRKLISEKSPAPGLKVVGKIDVTQFEKGKNKKKNKKRR